MYSQSSDLNLSISYNSFLCKSSSWTSGIASTISSDIGGSFYIENSTNTIYSIENVFENCYNGDSGGGFSIVNGTLNDENSSYKNNRA